MSSDVRLPFMDPLVLAIMAGEKTATRRMPRKNGAPPCKVGDRLAVCEALVRSRRMGMVAYRCSDDQGLFALRDGRCVPWPWKVRTLIPRYCPTWAIRTHLRCIAVDRRPLDEVDDDEARREGIARMGIAPTGVEFRRVFREMHKIAPDVDPMPWRIEFVREDS